MREQSLNKIPRRSFLKHASVFALALPALEFGTLGLLGCNQQTRSFARSSNAPDSANVPASTKEWISDVWKI